MMRFDVELTLNQSIEMLKNYSESEVKRDTATASYSIVKFIKPFTERFPLSLGSKVVKVIKTRSRRLGCIGLQILNTSDYTKFEHGMIYVHKTNRNYTRDQYFKVNSSDDLIKLCEKQLPSDCAGFYREYMNKANSKLVLTYHCIIELEENCTNLVNIHCRETKCTLVT